MNFAENNDIIIDNKLSSVITERKMELWLEYLIFIPLAYLIGSLNSAVIIAKIRNRDIKKIGSGNPGTMNMLRSVGKFWGCLTFIIDFFKGVAVALVGRLYFCSGFDTYLLGLIVIIGHCFSVFLRFKGGKGVATALGVFAVGNWIAFLIAFVALLVYLYFSKIGFLGSLLVTLGLSIACGVIEGLKDYRTAIIIAVICLLIFYTHRVNIIRFIKGKEHSLTLFGNEQTTSSDSEDNGADKPNGNCENTNNSGSKPI